MPTPLVSRISAFAGLLAVLLQLPTRAQTLVPFDSIWKYKADGLDQGAAWRDPEFPDSTWAIGDPPFGYGNGDEETVIPSSPNAAYFRTRFVVANPSSIQGLRLRYRRDDGVVIWLNGELVTSADFPAGLPAYDSPAPSPLTGAAEYELVELAVAPSLLVSGLNLIAVELHQSVDGETDAAFELELAAETAPTLTRGPYIQGTTTGSGIVRWRTDRPVIGVVRYGPAPADLTAQESESSPATEHEIMVTGLPSGTRCYYSIGDAQRTYAGGDLNHYFTTHPAPGSTGPVRVWILGDSGTGGPFNANARKVADAYLHSRNYRHPDVWLMLGDNAYGSGFDWEYQRAVFDTYADFLRNTTLWSTMGNHETYNGEEPLPYYRIFTFPKGAESGGVPSGTEHYYSFDYANVHFICLDSMTSALRQPGSPMMTWLQADLAATTQKWIIAFWHHPPYTRGSHDSDAETEHVEMRENFLPLLEAAGVDLVLGGHSHNYERSMLLDGFYGYSDSLEPGMILDAGLGRIGEGGAYGKLPGPRNGAIYTVAGHSGQAASYAPMDHPANIVNWGIMGSMYLDVDGDRLDATMIDINGVIRDTFTMSKVQPVAQLPPGTPLPPNDEWRVTHFGDNADEPRIAGDLADPDADGIVNLIERAFGMDPNDPTTAGLPSPGNGPELTIVFARPAAATDLKYVVQYSTDMHTWADGSTYFGGTIVPDTAVTTQVTRTGIDPEIITVRSVANGPGSHYLRVVVRR